VTYEEFVDRYCEGMTPVPQQERVIRAFTDGEPGRMSMTLRGSGKTQVIHWLRAAEDDRWGEPD
jgi:hypothetical protein